MCPRPKKYIIYSIFRSVDFCCCQVEIQSIKSASVQYLYRCKLQKKKQWHQTNDFSMEVCRVLMLIKLKQLCFRI